MAKYCYLSLYPHKRAMNLQVSSIFLVMHRRAQIGHRTTEASLQRRHLHIMYKKCDVVYLNSGFAPNQVFVTLAPSSAGSSSFQSHAIPSWPNLFIIDVAIFSKFPVARARIVGPAPERHMPSKPLCELGVTDCNISVRPGMSVFRYGWCTLSCMA